MAFPPSGKHSGGGSTVHDHGNKLNITVKVAISESEAIALIHHYGKSALFRSIHWSTVAFDLLHVPLWPILVGKPGASLDEVVEALDPAWRSTLSETGSR